MRKLGFVKETEPPSKHASQYVSAAFLAKKYGVSERHIHNLASGKAHPQIPSLKLGSKCTRFSEADVAKALEGGGGAA